MPEVLKAVALGDRLQHDLGYSPVIASEIEFYLHGADAQLTPGQVLAIIRQECAAHGIILFSSQQERGTNQFEAALLHSPDIAYIAAQDELFRQRMHDAFAPRGIMTDFSAKPLESEPGSGLHVHVHLQDDTGRNIFVRENDIFSSPLLHCLGGLLALMNGCMPMFAPTENSYRRFCAGFNAPTTLSWGINNRTVALRLPNKPLDVKHIEHRVAGSDADTADVIAAILAGIHYGLSKRSIAPEPVYGDASLAQYGLPPLARTLEEARRYRAEMKEIMASY